MSLVALEIEIKRSGESPADMIDFKSDQSLILHLNPPIIEDVLLKSKL